MLFGSLDKVKSGSHFRHDHRPALCAARPPCHSSHFWRQKAANTSQFLFKFVVQIKLPAHAAAFLLERSFLNCCDHRDSQDPPAVPRPVREHGPTHTGSGRASLNVSQHRLVQSCPRSCVAGTMCTFLLAVAILAGAAFIFRQIFVTGKECTSQLNLHGKTVIVTGSNTGIGKTTAIDLAKRGARVILACRSRERGECAVEDVKTATGSSQVVFMPLDLGSLKSVRSFAETFLKTEPRLDILINNAGVYMQGRTQDGLGLMFGVNHIGHFLLTNLLLERLKQCGPSRIVNVSSLGHNFGQVDFDCLTTHKALGLGTSAKEVFQLYCGSKLCNVLFTHELAKRLRGTQVTCYSLHPGAINTELARNISSVMQLLIRPLTLFFFKNSVQGSQTTLHCALQEGLEPLSGRYFSNCTVRDVYPKAKDDAAAKKLWELSERLSGL